MEEETLINSGRWSRRYRCQDIFIKELVHYEPKAMRREMRANQVAFSHGINTPLCRGCSDDGVRLRLYYNYLNLRDLNSISDCISSEILKNIKLLQSVEWDKNDLYWKNYLLPDFFHALSFLGTEGAIFYSYLAHLPMEIFIHGDLSYENIGLCNGQVYIYDFQHGCLGPKGWDLGYLAGSVNPRQCKSLGLSAADKQMAYCVSAIKLGRAIRKNSSTANDKRINYLAWREYIGI